MLNIFHERGELTFEDFFIFKNHLNYRMVLLLFFDGVFKIDENENYSLLPRKKNLIRTFIKVLDLTFGLPYLSITNQLLD